MGNLKTPNSDAENRMAAARARGKGWGNGEKEVKITISRCKF